MHRDPEIPPSQTQPVGQGDFDHSGFKVVKPVRSFPLDGKIEIYFCWRLADKLSRAADLFVQQRFITPVSEGAKENRLISEIENQAIVIGRVDEKDQPLTFT